MQDPCIRSVLVQLGEPEWTSEALHVACTVARANACELTIVKLVPVGQPGWLGLELGNANFTSADHKLLRECAITAEDYGIQCSVSLYQYLILSDAIVDAADYFDAHLTFATLPHFKLPFWRRFLTWRSRQQFQARGRMLNTLEEPITLEDWIPAPTASSFITAERTH
jgi:hypothetical protein